MRDILNPKTRTWVYGIAVAAFGVLGVYGILTTEQIAAWALLASAICGLAYSNVNREGADNALGDGE